MTKMRQGVQGWCTVMTLRDGMGREAGGGFKMGTTCMKLQYFCHLMGRTDSLEKILMLGKVEVRRRSG